MNAWNAYGRAAAIAWLIAAPCGASAQDAGPAVGPQYDTTHVYVAAADRDRFVASFLATFGGSATKPVVTTVTPTASSTMSQVAMTPVGTISIFSFLTPIPYPFGSERTGYLVREMDGSVRAARSAGADVVVAPFPDPIGRDAVIAWPGGVYMQLYWHTTAPSYAAFAHVPENRVYVPAESAAAFVRDFVAFSHGTIVSDDDRAPGIEIGRPGSVYRRIRITSTFGKMVVLVSDGHLPYPYGRELTGYEVDNLAGTIRKATASGATIVVSPYVSGGRRSAIIAFPGGYLAEIHELVPT